jgi:hypothetical protein
MYEEGVEPFLSIFKKIDVRNRYRIIETNFYQKLKVIYICSGNCIHGLDSLSLSPFFGIFAVYWTRWQTRWVQVGCDNLGLFYNWNCDVRRGGGWGLVNLIPE